MGIRGALVFATKRYFKLSFLFLIFSYSHSITAQDNFNGIHLIGEEVEELSITHINDIDMVGFSFLGANLDTEDDGRTGGFLFNYYKQEKTFSLSISYENWVFSKKMGDNGEDIIEQNRKVRETLEKHTLTAQYKKYLGSDGKKYIVLGFQAIGDYSGQGINSEFQNLLHEIVGHTQTVGFQDTDEMEVYGHFFFGAGMQSVFVEKEKWALIGEGEVVLAPSTLFEDESFLGLRLGFNTKIGNGEHPFELDIFLNERIYSDEHDYARGIKLSKQLGKHNNWSPFIGYTEYRSDEDRYYNGGKNPTTSVGVTLTLGHRHHSLKKHRNKH